MKQLFFSSLAIIMLLITAFRPIALAEETVVQKRSLKKFSAVSLQVPAKVTLRQGAQHFQIKASEAVLQSIEVNVRSGELIIRFPRNSDLPTSETIEIEIAMPEIVALEINGSGTITAPDEIKGSQLGLEINGSGNISISHLSVEGLSAVINGSGSMTGLTGNAGTLNLQVNGSGKMDTPGLTGREVTSSVTGSGFICMGATESLLAEITGSGDIRYNGSPIHKSVDISGTGSVTAMK